MNVKCFLISSDEKRLQENEVHQKLGKLLNIEVVKTEKQTNPEKGCYDAHYLVAQIAARRDIDYYICFEDNSAINKFNAHKFFQTVNYIKRKQLPLVYLARMPHPTMGQGIKHYSRNIYTNHPTINGCVAYMMGREFRNKFLKWKYSSVNIPVDEQFKNLLTKEYFVHPTPFRRRNNCTSIVNKGGLRYFFRKIYYHPIYHNILSFIEMYQGMIAIILLILIIVVFFSQCKT